MADDGESTVSDLMERSSVNGGFSIGTLGFWKVDPSF